MKDGNFIKNIGYIGQEAVFRALCIGKGLHFATTKLVQNKTNHCNNIWQRKTQRYLLTVKIMVEVFLTRIASVYEKNIFKCNVCDKTFFAKKNMKKHEPLHMKERSLLNANFVKLQFIKERGHLDVKVVTRFFLINNPLRNM